MWGCVYNRRRLRRRKTSIVFLMLACFAIAVLGSSCARAPTDIEVVRLFVSGAANWDVDPEPDGIQLIIRPQDSNGFTVKAEVSVNARLWSQPDDFREEKDKLILEWSDIHVTKKDYREDLLARIHLEYNDYTPVPGARGILEVTVTTPDGSSFTSQENNISLNPPREIREQPPSCSCPYGG